MQRIKIEYVWIDGLEPWGLRSKVCIPELTEEAIMRLSAGDCRYAQDWSFDGSSTGQAPSNNSDCVLHPIKVINDPLEASNFIAFCEVMNADGSPHETNSRHLTTTLVTETEGHEPWLGFEQEYTVMSEGRPLGFPHHPEHYPRPQGIYYCSAGGDRAFGRNISSAHANACINAGIHISGTNAEVMPGQWEFQVGGENCDALVASDDLWLARWLLIRIAEAYNVNVSFEPKPIQGDWNGAGCHTNLSTNTMRAEGGYPAIEQACEKLAKNVEEHLPVYGHDLASRLTGEHETCVMDEFRWGVADRTASVRIPHHVAKAKKGYLEDRRPNANCDPYKVSSALLRTLCLEP